MNKKQFLQENLLLQKKISEYSLQLQVLSGEKEAIEHHEQELRHEIHRIRSFQHIFSKISSTIDRNDVLKMVLNALADLMETEGASIFLLDPTDATTLVLEVASNLDITDTTKKIRVPVGSGIAGTVAQTGEIINIKDADTDPRVIKTAAVTGVTVKTILCGPLMVKQRMIGVAQLINHKGSHPFSSNDERLFQEFSQQVAMAIENATFYTQLMDHQIQTDHQNRQLLEIAYSIKDILASLTFLTSKVEEAVQITGNTTHIVTRGVSSAKDLYLEFQQVHLQVQDAAKDIQTLDKNVSQIGNFIHSIETIAQKTNVLAINAAIESARAGSQGRGFAVVVDEIRKLSSQTSSATNQIREMLEKIQSNSVQIDHSTQMVLEEIRRGLEFARNSELNLKEIDATIQSTLDQITIIAKTNRDLQDTATKVFNSVKQVKELHGS